MNCEILNQKKTRNSQSHAIAKIMTSKTVESQNMHINIYVDVYCHKPCADSRGKEPEYGIHFGKIKMLWSSSRLTTRVGSRNLKWRRKRGTHLDFPMAEKKGWSP